MRNFLLLLLVALTMAVFQQSAHARSDKQIEAEGYSKSLGQKVARKVGEQALQLHKLYMAGLIVNKEATVDGAVEEFLRWLAAEVGEAIDIKNDLRNFVSSSRVVFAAACDNDKDIYIQSWGTFLSIVLKYAGYIGCMYVEPIFLPPICFVVGHIVGKYAGKEIGTLIWDGKCGGGQFDEAAIIAINARVQSAIMRVDPYGSPEWVGFTYDVVDETDRDQPEH